MPPCECPTSSTGSSGPMPACVHRLEDALLVGVRQPGAQQQVGRQVADVVVLGPRQRRHVVGAGEVDDVPVADASAPRWCRCRAESGSGESAATLGEVADEALEVGRAAPRRAVACGSTRRAARRGRSTRRGQPCLQLRQHRDPEPRLDGAVGDLEPGDHAADQQRVGLPAHRAGEHAVRPAWSRRAPPPPRARRSAATAAPRRPGRGRPWCGRRARPSRAARCRRGRRRRRDRAPRRTPPPGRRCRR